MNLPSILYFISVLLTFLLTGFLAWYAWRRPPLPGVRMYAGLALGECLLAMVEILSLVGTAQAQAHFWFNLRFLFTGIIPVLFMVFALEHLGRKNWLSRPLLVLAFSLPALSQFFIWTNNLTGLWVKQDVVFHQDGPFWMVDTSARIPAAWFIVHSMYIFGLLLAGMVVILLDMKLDGISGVDVLKEIQQRYPDLPVLMVTGYRQEMTAAIQAALAPHAFTCLYQPLEIPTLLQTLSDLQLKRLRKVIRKRVG